MTEAQERIFEHLRDVAEFAHRNKLHRLQEAIDRAEETALLELYSIDLSHPISIEDYTDEVGGVSPFRAKAKV